MSEARDLVNAWLKDRTTKAKVPGITIEEIIEGKEEESFHPRALISLAKFCNEKVRK